MADVAVANEILRQIGVRNRMAIGSRDAVALNEQRGGVMFRVGSGTRLSKVIIILTGRDTYDVSYVEMSNRAPYKELYRTSLNDIYADQIGEVVYDLVHHKGSHRRKGNPFTRDLPSHNPGGRLRRRKTRKATSWRRRR